MSPRIQVYKAIACRTLNQAEETPGLQYISSVAVDCTGPEVQARAAKIQACMFPAVTPMPTLLIKSHSRCDSDECFERHHDRVLEPSRR